MPSRELRAPAAAPARRHGIRDAAGGGSELDERGVAQQQALGAGLGAEVDVRHRLVALALDAHDGAEPEGVVADPVAGVQRDDRALAGAADSGSGGERRDGRAVGAARTAEGGAEALP